MSFTLRPAAVSLNSGDGLRLSRDLSRLSLAAKLV